MQLDEVLFLHSNVQLPGLPKTPDTGLPSIEEGCEQVNEYLRAWLRSNNLTPIRTEEKQGRDIHDIIPVKGKEGSFSNEGIEYFPFHVEVPHAPLKDRPDGLLLLCLRGDVDVDTLLIPVARLLQFVPFSVQASMRRVQYSALYGESFGDRKQYVTQLLHPDGSVTIDLAEMRGDTAGAESTLEELKQIIDRHRKELVTSVNLKAGDILVFDNKKCIHARGGKDSPVIYDGNQRWLKRVYFKGQL